MGTDAFATSTCEHKKSQRAEGKVCLDRKKYPEMGF
ncbi:hypothetical protein PFWH6_5871 [Pseudomonas fluorescens WH6]|nr:hypothetical protein PFWH6_5871 [Pseudomonas fluorescens WH6]